MELFFQGYLDELQVQTANGPWLVYPSSKLELRAELPKATYHSGQDTAPLFVLPLGFTSGADPHRPITSTNCGTGCKNS
jgi:hypothetical protein